MTRDATDGWPDPVTGPVLAAALDALVPADEHPGATATGGVAFVQRRAADDPATAAGLDRALRLLDDAARRRHGAGFAELAGPDRSDVLAALRAGDAGAAVELLERLAIAGFYGDPGHGGNRGAASWRMVGYRAGPLGGSWPDVAGEAPPVVPWSAVAARYDAVVVGAGAGGGVAACVLAEAGHRVLLVERGPWLGAADLPQDHLRSQRPVPGVTDGYDPLAGPPAAGHPRVLDDGSVVAPWEARWGGTAATVGGGTRVYGAQAWRFDATDLAMASTYGVPEGSSLADWPLAPDDLERSYRWVEHALGVAGDTTAPGGPGGGLPMPPVRAGTVGAVLAAGAAALGWETTRVPLLVNSVPRDGRGACLQCGACVGFACPGEFKNDTRNTVIPRAVATGRCDVVTGTTATRLVTDADGRVVAVELATETETDGGGGVERRVVRAEQVLLGGGAVETARLLLLSRSDREPDGLGNAFDHVGRHLQGHVYAGALGVFDEPVQDGVGPGPSVSVHRFRHPGDGVVGGGMLADDFVMTPLQAWSALTSSGLAPTSGRTGKDAMRTLYRRLALVVGPVQEVPTPGSRVTLDPRVRDRFGSPVARLGGRLHPEDHRAAAMLTDRAAQWLRASGATTVVPRGGAWSQGPSGGQHQAGTCRMGSDPRSSVTDPWGRVWGHDNLFVVDGALHVTNGGVNPVLTILALAHRVSSRLAGTS